VCDSCNHYAGRKLERVLVGHPLIAIPLQLGRLPGKAGKPRKRLGVYEIDVTPEGGITFPIEEPKIWIDKKGVKRAKFSIHPLIDPNFDFDRYRRALHHIGLNLTAINEGLETVLREEFDPVRKYVRAPKKNERWPFVEITEQFSKFVPGVDAKRLSFDRGLLIRLRIFNTTYFIDLLNSGCLLTSRVSGKGAKIFLPEYKSPTPKVDPRRRYRATII
jgi:hypothetical protein